MSEVSFVSSALLRNDYPKGAVHEAIDALELSYSYLRDRPIIAAKINEALDLLYRARELSEGTKHPYRKPAA